MCNACIEAGVNFHPYDHDVPHDVADLPRVEFITTTSSTSASPLTSSLSDSGEGTTSRRHWENSGDAPFTTKTQYTMAVGDDFIGHIDRAGDADAIKISLDAGVSYTFNLYGRDYSGISGLSDPVLELYNSSASRVAYNDDGGAGLNSKITYTAAYSGDYYIAAKGFSTRTGTYDIDVEPTSTPTYPQSQLHFYLDKRIP